MDEIEDMVRARGKIQKIVKTCFHGIVIRHLVPAMNFETQMEFTVAVQRKLPGEEVP